MRVKLLPPLAVRRSFSESRKKVRDEEPALA
jgi:hypothetical protein